MRALMLALLLLSVCTGASAQITKTTNPFGMVLEANAPQHLQKKWRDVRAASIPDDPEVVAFATQFKGLTGRVLVAHINLAVNLHVRAMSDMAVWGVEDHWSTPSQTLAMQVGDCEDYAILKNEILSRYFKPEDHGTLLLHDRVIGEGHMVAMVRLDGKWYILNNQTNMLVEDVLLPSRFKPEYFLNDQGAFNLAPFIPKVAQQTS